jgi:hypothetical protein
MTLDDLAADVLEDGRVDSPWELFRVVYFPGREHEQAAEELARWAVQSGIAIDFETRRREIGGQMMDVIYVVLTPRER